MGVINLTEGLCRELTQQIKNLNEQPVSFLKKTSLVSEKAAACIREINLHLKEYKFENEADEIRFFKEQLPEVYAQHYIYLKLYQMESKKPVITEKLEKYFLKHRDQMDEFLEEHQGFYRYYMEESTFMDKQYFTRHGEHYNCMEFFMPIMDFDCLTPYCIKVSMILAFEFVKNYIDGILLKLKENAGLTDMPLIEQRNLRQKKVVWTGKLVDLVELTLHFHANGLLNDGKISLTQTFSIMEDYFHVPMPNGLRTIQDVYNRQKEKFMLLEKMREGSTRYLEKNYNNSGR